MAEEEIAAVEEEKAWRKSQEAKMQQDNPGEDYSDFEAQQGKALEALHNPKNPKAMGVLKDQEELRAPRLMYSIADGCCLSWLKDEADNYLKISGSGQGGKAREQTAKTFQAMNGDNGEDEKGLIQRAKSFITRQG